jgi:hypothetical protein
VALSHLVAANFCVVTGIGTHKAMAMQFIGNIFQDMAAGASVCGTQMVLTAAFVDITGVAAVVRAGDLRSIGKVVIAKWARHAFALAVVMATSLKINVAAGPVLAIQRVSLRLVRLSLRTLQSVALGNSVAAVVQVIITTSP